MNNIPRSKGTDAHPTMTDDITIDEQPTVVLLSRETATDGGDW